MATISLMFPLNSGREYKDISDEAFHDLGLEHIVEVLSQKELEKGIIRRFLGRVSPEPEISQYRADVFEDIVRLPSMTEKLGELLERLNFLKNFGSFSRKTDATGLWELLHRLDEMKEYVDCVESVYECLLNEPIKAQGLIDLREHAKKLYTDTGFLELKKDIENIKADTNNIKSVTLGINVNQRLEACSIGIVSINKKYFSKSDIISNFADHLSRSDNLNETCDWDEDYSYRPPKQKSILTEGGIESFGLMKTAFANPIFAPALLRGMVGTVPGEASESTMQYMDSIAQQMLNRTSRRLTEIVSKHVAIDLAEMINLIPELMYYIRWAELIGKLKELGLHFAKPSIGNKTELKGFFNMKLALAALNGDMKAEDIVTNDLTFDDDKNIFILTGANRGGKTTLTQAVGQVILMAQSGICVPGYSFSFMPVDDIFTHFPADEDKTMDLGRLGEECKRFKEMYSESTKDSLILLNETFSTTSYEEGYYIAYDAIRALRLKNVRTIYNTHMHKLGQETDALNEGAGKGKTASLLMISENGNRSFKVELAPPQGSSFARDIAVKYGVTYEQLTEERSK